MVTAGALKPTTTTTRLEIDSTVPRSTAGGKAVITSVVFSGGEASPVITISGRSFGSRPPPYPPGAPSKFNFQDRSSNCNQTAGDEGLDYGTQLSVHTDDNTFTAGRYRGGPDKAELDCVGLVVDEFTDSRVVLRLGGAYQADRGRLNFTIRNGYRFEVVVGSAELRGIVRYS